MANEHRHFSFMMFSQILGSKDCSECGRRHW